MKVIFKMVNWNHSMEMLEMFPIKVGVFKNANSMENRLTGFEYSSYIWSIGNGRLRRASPGIQ